jgi:hypothetical protein
LEETKTPWPSGWPAVGSNPTKKEGVKKKEHFLCIAIHLNLLSLTILELFSTVGVRSHSIPVINLFLKLNGEGVGIWRSLMRNFKASSTTLLVYDGAQQLK